MNNLIKLMCFGVIFSGMAYGEGHIMMERGDSIDPVMAKEADPVDVKKWGGFGIN